MELAELISPELVFPGLPGGDVTGVLRSFAEALAAAHAVRDGDDLFHRLAERETLGSTAIGNGVALPHCKLPGLRTVRVGLGLLAEAVDFHAADGRPVRVLFGVVSPEDMPAAHLKALAAISRWVRQDGHVAQLLALRDPLAIHRYLESGEVPAAR